MPTPAFLVPGFARVRNSWKPGSEVPSAKRKSVAGAVKPKASWPSETMPEPKSCTKYSGRSATIDGPDVTSTVAPTPVHVAPRRPLGSVASETRMVVLLDPGSVIERGPGIARSQCSVWYERLTVDADCGSGFWRVRNSVKSGRVVPSPKVHERAGDLVPTWVF